jgi:hypothetical protein
MAVKWGLVLCMFCWPSLKKQLGENEWKSGGFRVTRKRVDFCVRRVCKKQGSKYFVKEQKTAVFRVTRKTGKNCLFSTAPENQRKTNRFRSTRKTTKRTAFSGALEK